MIGTSVAVQVARVTPGEAGDGVRCGDRWPRRLHDVLAAAEEAAGDDPSSWSHVRVATKYPALTCRHFEARGVQAECIKLNGAMELAPILGLSTRIVDLVSSGRTLKENGLIEVEVITQVTSRLIVNRAAFKTRAADIAPLVEAFRRAAETTDAG